MAGLSEKANKLREKFIEKYNMPPRGWSHGEETMREYENYLEQELIDYGTEYEIELEKLRQEYMQESEQALKETDNLYNKKVKELGHNSFLSQNINIPIIECNKKYQEKIKKLKEKYSIQY